MSVLISPVRLAITSTFILTACLAGQDRGGTPPGDGRVQIGGLFSKANASGSLEYWGVCSKDFYPDFPKLKGTSGREGSVVESLREVFSIDPKMIVSQDIDGKIRMIEEDVPSDLLEVKIHHLRFPPEYHGPHVAISVILHSPEVVAFRIEHLIKPQADWGSSFGFPSDAFAVAKPSVLGDLHDVTVRQALDYVLLTYHGFWVYENCKSLGAGRTVWIGFFENMPDTIPVPNGK